MPKSETDLYIANWLLRQNHTENKEKEIDNLAIIDGLAMKDKRSIILEELQQQTWRQQHMNHVGTEKLRLLARESVHWVIMKNDIEKAIKNCTVSLRFQQMYSKDKTIPYNMLGKPSEVIWTDIFKINDENFAFIIDYFR